MLTEPPSSGSKKADTQSPVLAALTSAYHLMQQRIISQPKDMMGILLYGTEASKFPDEVENSRGGLSYPGCYLFTDLDVPEAEDVKALKRLVEDDSSEARETSCFAPTRSSPRKHQTSHHAGYSSSRTMITLTLRKKLYARLLLYVPKIYMISVWCSSSSPSRPPPMSSTENSSTTT
jgi:hypothetical protein